MWRYSIPNKYSLVFPRKEAIHKDYKGTTPNDSIIKQGLIRNRNRYRIPIAIGTDIIKGRFPNILKF